MRASARRRDRRRRPWHRRARERRRARLRPPGAPPPSRARRRPAATWMRSPTTMAPRPNGLPRLARSQELKSKRRLVTTAVGAIGRPESRASATMPAPATRARLGTSAVIATDTPPRARAAFRAWRERRPCAAMRSRPSTRAADRRDAEPTQGDRVDAAVAMARDQRGHARDRARPGEGNHEVLAVPHRHDQRRLAGDRGVDVRRARW